MLDVDQALYERECKPSEPFSAIVVGVLPGQQCHSRTQVNVENKPGESGLAYVLILAHEEC